MKINVKHLGKRRQSIEQVDMVLDKTPVTVKELLEETVKVCVKQYKERQENQEILRVLSKEEIDNLATGGKVIFGIPSGESTPILIKAIENVKQSFMDGIVVLFIDGKEMHELMTPINITEHTNVTFVRMTMLSGRLW